MPPTSLVDHYNDHQKSTYHTPTRARKGQDGPLKLLSDNHQPESQFIGSSSVDNMHDASDGVWHPDRWTLSFVWCGSECEELDMGFPEVFDPFLPIQHLHNSLVLAYTEQLPSGAECLQPYMSCTRFEGVAHDRGNLAIADQGRRGWGGTSMQRAWLGVVWWGGRCVHACACGSCRLVPVHVSMWCVCMQLCMYAHVGVLVGKQVS